MKYQSPGDEAGIGRASGTKRAAVEADREWLGRLEREERLALEYFYINRRRNAADSLCEALCVERTTAYKIRGQALHKYIVRTYGLV